MEKKQIPLITNITMYGAAKKRTPTVRVLGREFFSLTYRESGSITIHSEMGDLLSPAGSITYIPRGLSYDTEVLEDGFMHILHVYTAGEATLFGDRPLCARPASPEGVLENFIKARTRFDADGMSFSCMSTVMRILGMAEAAFLPVRDLPPPRLKRAKQYMDESFTDTALRIGDFAAVRGVSEVYFRKEFRHFYGMSPLEYIKQKRVETAARMLETGLYNVTDAALQSGFPSVAYFSAEFRRMMGVSPTEYVKSLEDI